MTSFGLTQRLAEWRQHAIAREYLAELTLLNALQDVLDLHTSEIRGVYGLVCTGHPYTVVKFKECPERLAIAKALAADL